MGNRQDIDKNQVRRASQHGGSEGTSTVQQLVFTAAGAAGSALVAAMLTRRGFEPKTVSGAIAALGAGLASIGDSDAVRALGAGAMSGSGAQLVLMLFSAREDKRNHAVEQASPTAEAANANVVPLAAKAVAS